MPFQRALYHHGAAGEPRPPRRCDQYQSIVGALLSIINVPTFITSERLSSRLDSVALIDLLQHCPAVNLHPELRARRDRAAQLPMERVDLSRRRRQALLELF